MPGIVTLAMSDFVNLKQSNNPDDFELIKVLCERRTVKLE